MLQPKNQNSENNLKAECMGNSKGGNLLNFGAYGLKALTPARITSRQIEWKEKMYLKTSKKIWSCMD